MDKFQVAVLVLLSIIACIVFAGVGMALIFVMQPSRQVASSVVTTITPTNTESSSPTPQPTFEPTSTPELQIDLSFDRDLPELSYRELAQAIAAKHRSTVEYIEVEQLPSGRFSVYIATRRPAEWDSQKLLAIAYDFHKYVYSHSDWPTGFAHIHSEGGIENERVCVVGGAMAYELGESYDWNRNGIDEWFNYLSKEVTDYRDGGPNSGPKDYDDEKTYFASKNSLCD